MSKEQTARTFSRAAPAFDRTGPHFFARSGRRLAELAQIAMGATVLDVASGRGAVLLPAAEQTGPQGRVVGVDLAPGMLRELAAEVRGAGQGHVQLCQMDAEKLAFAPGTFDCVLCGHSIVFFPQALAEFHRVLGPGGKICASIVAQGCLDWLLDAMDVHAVGAGRRDERRPDFVLDTPLGLEGALRQAGFVDVQVSEERDDLVYADEEAWWRTLWTMGFRGTLEAMQPAAVHALQAQVFRALQAFRRPDGIHILFRVLFGIGIK